MTIIRKHWISLVGLLMVGLAIAFGWNWMWGILFLFWSVPALWTGVNYMGDAIHKSEHPFLFWLVTILWLSLSLYLVTEPLLPPEWRSTVPVSAEEYMAPPANPIPTVSKGNYVEKVPAWQQRKIDSVGKQPDSLRYKRYASDAHSYIGVSVSTAFMNNQYVRDIDELWNYFLENDISEVIPNIDDQRVYLIYSGYDKPEKGWFKVTIGYRTRDLSYIYDGLEGITIPAMNFAVFESQGEPETFIATTWQQVAASALPRANRFDLEVYTMDEKTAEISHSELRVSLKN